jgi:NADP-dependent 3-hydroxy acid dehydrogenase YdfG
VAGAKIKKQTIADSNKNKEFAGRGALITGGTSGVGAVAARHMNR